MSPPPAPEHRGSPFGYGYAPPAFARGRPPVITWFRVYAVTTLLLYVALVVGWLVFAADMPGLGADEQAFMLFAIGAATLLGGAFYAVAALVPYKPWGWTVGLIAICFGLSSCMAFPAVALLIYWMKPETKAAFGRL